ncbi:hypothetical protein [Ramlibacter sp.]|uniref:hypothetical protein n=1 Tax=Ramlibacter sp. TaxID=1917967 RepID=UPI00179B6B5A|nr:hypothetical protein [Ramlibacter sp.]MBA2674728.1 hypothetical protein [Ramlibacter sp.]
MPQAPVLLAHRGLAQQFDTRDLHKHTCTAARMLPHTHGYLENTIASMRAADHRRPLRRVPRLDAGLPKCWRHFGTTASSST